MVSASPVLLEQKTLKLPGLGDSITEVRGYIFGVGPCNNSVILFVIKTHWCLSFLLDNFSLQGSIVEWTAAVGQAVKEGDVVAMVETDKVTVDIKAEMDGVIVEHFCEL